MRVTSETGPFGLGFITRYLHGQCSTRVLPRPGPRHLRHAVHSRRGVSHVQLDQQLILAEPPGPVRPEPGVLHARLCVQAASCTASQGVSLTDGTCTCTMNLCTDGSCCDFCEHRQRRLLRSRNHRGVLRTVAAPAPARGPNGTCPTCTQSVVCNGACCSAPGPCAADGSCPTLRPVGVQRRMLLGARPLRGRRLLLHSHHDLPLWPDLRDGQRRLRRHDQLRYLHRPADLRRRRHRQRLRSCTPHPDLPLWPDLRDGQRQRLRRDDHPRHLHGPADLRRRRHGERLRLHSHPDLPLWPDLRDGQRRLRRHDHLRHLHPPADLRHAERLRLHSHHDLPLWPELRDGQRRLRRHDRLRHLHRPADLRRRRRRQRLRLHSHPDLPLGAQNCGTASDGCGGTIACGTCTAPQTCGGGGAANVCGTCPAGSMLCNGTCVDTQTDDDNCGGCNNPCSTGTTCAGKASAAPASWWTASAARPGTMNVCNGTCCSASCAPDGSCCAAVCNGACCSSPCLPDGSCCSPPSLSVDACGLVPLPETGFCFPEPAGGALVARPPTFRCERLLLFARPIPRKCVPGWAKTSAARACAPAWASAWRDREHPRSRHVPS